MEVWKRKTTIQLVKYFYQLEQEKKNSKQARQIEQEQEQIGYELFSRIEPITNSAGKRMVKQKSKK